MYAMKLPAYACGLLCRSLIGQAMPFDLGFVALLLPYSLLSANLLGVLFFAA